jgi:hypothetical protein
MSLADQFVADASGGGNAVAAPSLADQFASDIAAKPSLPPSPAQKAPQTSALGEFGRQLGLTARAGATGITALPAIVGDALNTAANYGIRGINSVTGSSIPEFSMPSNAVQAGLNAAGLPQPKNATERVVQDAASAVASVLTGRGLGMVLQTAASPVTQAVGQLLQAAPGMQMAGAAGAGIGSSGARELGLGPGWQLGAGLLGGTAGVLAGSAATSGVRALSNRFGGSPAVSPAAAAARADAGVNQAVSELGPQAAQLYGGTSPDAQNPILNQLKQQVSTAIEQNPNVSPAAAMRAQDFRDLGIQPTLGQITRDPVQFAGELNMRGLRGVGDPLANRFNQQNTQLQQSLYGLAGNASDAYQAGSNLKSTLQSIDSQMAQQVRDAYSAAQASSGKNLNVPLTGVAQDYANVLNNFGDKVPSGVRNNFEQLGLMSGTQNKTFTIENAENLLKVINANQSNDRATNAALGQLRNSVKNAILSADDQGGVFAQPRQLASQRFAMHEQIPALEAAASDSINPDDFVRRFIIGGKTDQTSALARLLRDQAPDAFNEAKNQIGAQLALKGFGQNVAGDAPFKPAAFSQQLQTLGPQKLAAFYSPDELAQLYGIGRVGSYINAFPSAAPVNTSNTAGAIGSLVSAGVGKIPWVGGLLENAQNRAFVNRALVGSLSNAAQQTPMAPGGGLLTPFLTAPVTSRPQGSR